MTDKKQETPASREIYKKAVKMRIFKKFLKGVAEMEAFHGTGLIEELTDPQINWTKISLVEAAMFNINPHLNNALCVAYSRFEGMLDICVTDPFDETDAEDDRDIFKEYMPERWTPDYHVFCPSMAASFMAEACKLPLLDCVGYVQMRDASMRRAGLVICHESLPEGEVLH
jgi:hypothetical protein